jgi:hypothetical protein
MGHVRFHPHNGSVQVGSVTIEMDDQQEHGSRLLLRDETGGRLDPRPIVRSDESAAACLREARPLDQGRASRAPAEVLGRRALRRCGEIVRSFVDAYGEGLGKPVLEGASLQGEVVSRTYPHHFSDRR